MANSTAQTRPIHHSDRNRRRWAYHRSVLTAVVAALSGLVWGMGDFAGGKATQRAGALSVTWLSKVASLPLLALFLLLFPASPHLGALGWGAVAGALGTAGLVVFYKAMAQGAMTVVAPVAAVTSAGLPVLVGLVLGERPGGVRLIGVTCAVVAIGLVSLVSDPAPPDVAPNHGGRVRAAVGPRLIGSAVLAGVLFAAFFVCLRQAGRVGGDAGLWPNASAQLIAVLMTGVLLAWRRGTWPSGSALAWTAAAGPLDLTANVLYLVAAREGELTLVAPLAALYPVSTVLLAMLIDRERLRGIQRLGLGLAVAALVLVSR